ncbi:fucolectin-like [Mytilus edulis]|uniref:fucolectin-like n=1 Tax=Mytilus edulis TaxID=6550 RepID=UPI0039EFC645
MTFAKMLYCATVLIFGCTMLSSACEIGLSNYKGKFLKNNRLLEKVLKLETMLNTTLKKREEMLNQMLESPCKDPLTGHLRIEDVSHEKMTSQSSHNALYPSGNAVDGDLTTMFMTNFDKKPYWWVDLGSSFSVHHVEIWNRADNVGRRLRKMDILVGPTLSKMKLCTYYKGHANNGEYLILNCSKPTNGRYVKLAIGVQEWFNLMEVKVFAYSKTCLADE